MAVGFAAIYSHQGQPVWTWTGAATLVGSPNSQAVVLSFSSTCFSPCRQVLTVLPGLAAEQTGPTCCLGHAPRVTQQLRNQVCRCSAPQHLSSEQICTFILTFDKKLLFFTVQRLGCEDKGHSRLGVCRGPTLRFIDAPSSSGRSLCFL